MDLNRRDFLKLSGATSLGVLVLPPFAFEGRLPLAKPGIVLKKKVKETYSICAYCGAGCGIVIAAENGKVINVEGDPDHPINRGALCSKAQSLYQLRTVNGADNPRRLTKVLYRAPNGTDWQEKSWDWALGEIAKRIKQTRDANWVEKDSAGVMVNRTEAIAHLGGAAHDNEECYLLAKMNRALGLVYLEHQARI